MGRPLNNKYFGNRNIGSSSTTDDDGIGGGFIASATIDTAGSYTSATTATFAAPTLPGGVTATGTLVYEVISATISGGTGYGNTQTFDLTVTTAAGTAVLNVTSDTGGDVITVNSITTAGTFTGISAVTSVSGGTGNDDAVPVLTYGIKDITITEQGSGYATLPAITIGAGAGAATAVFGVDSGTIRTAGNQENAITMIAFLTGGSALPVDIIKQVSTDRYKVTDGTRTGIVQLQTTLANAAGECSIAATDSAGGTYYVTKLTAHRATLTRGTGTQFDSDASVPWTFGTATLNETVKIPNA